ncbi:putative vacuolar cation/proton exchanger 2 [Aureobasidium pullulans]|nr:putative vacuolar cation/proton exchanger 2 [Aureobasidium pullulans]THW21102.1 putative vacuolar cation/proton exchanger 2 [Aureobasidium pullulans]THW90200.1 putative vacuolar cation/proton exchanger 2 [Aureobasidium pullulans]THX88210.1 putative vacuolar cation/proton exchanger 2 [Aureobasidium pullulans]THX99732.1 putative vacuolar cation/proton exchanger 2 [Aureobasidium pullulans]
MTTRPKPRRGSRQSTSPYSHEPKPRQEREDGRLPEYNHNGHAVTPGIKPAGESGRRGFHPLHFFKVCWNSSCTASKYVNVLWPFVPAAIALHFARPQEHLWIFILSYIAMVPSANLIGFAGQELARKLPTVFGVVLETTLGSLVEIILFIVLLKLNGGDGSGVPIIQAAILGSILANLLLCIGLCFFFGGLRREDQTFHDVVSDTGSNLMLVAGMALVIPVIFSNALTGRENLTVERLEAEVLRISRATAIVLLVAYAVYIFFQMKSHHGLYDDILEADEEQDADRHRDLAKPKLTLTESIIALAFAITFVSMMAVFLVQNIEWMVEHRHVPDAFLGLILIPLVEKAAEHITAVDEAWDNQMNFALSHVLGASIQTALLNTPLVVIVGWGLGIDMSLNFEMFHAVVLILAILVVGGFLRDGKSNYLEGALCFFVYVLIAVAAFYYPNPVHGQEGEGSSEPAGEVAARFR